MKVVAVLAAVVMMAVLGIVAGVNRKALRWLALAIPLPMMKWPSFAVMLFSAEFYRGTCRGMEISLCYLLSFAMMVALTFRRMKGRFLPDWGAVFFFLYWLLSIPSLMNCHPDIDPGLNQTGYMYAWYEIWKMPMMFMVYKAVRGYCKLTDDVDAPLIGLGIVAVANFLEVDGENGLLFDPSDVAALASAIARVLDGPDLAERLIDGGLRTSACFTWPHVIDDLDRVYGEVRRSFPRQ